MKRRNKLGQYESDRSERWRQIIGCSILGGISLGIFINVALTPAVEIVEAEQLSAEPEEVMIEVVIDWSPDRIEQEIRETFPEAPNTAVAIAKAEGGLVKERQSQIIKNGIQEPSFCAMQIHEPSWDHVAKKLGYEDYKTNPAHCIAMARYIYDAAGQRFTDWSAYNNGSYKKHL